jgi:hypothetical protein
MNNLIDDDRPRMEPAQCLAPVPPIRYEEKEK